MKMLEDLEEVVRLRNERIIAAKTGDNARWEELCDECENAFDKFLATHHATIRDMAARLEAAERDAARYRWLQDMENAAEVGIYGAIGRKDLDQAIDTAMQETGR